MTLERAKELVRMAGFKVLNGGCFEDDRQIYAQSVEADQRCYNHPLFEVQFNKETRWLSVTGQSPKQLFSAGGGQ